MKNPDDIEHPAALAHKQELHDLGSMKNQAVTRVISAHTALLEAKKELCLAKVAVKTIDEHLEKELREEPPAVLSEQEREQRTSKLRELLEIQPHLPDQ